LRSWQTLTQTFARQKPPSDGGHRVLGERQVQFEQQGKAATEAEASGIPKHRLKAKSRFEQPGKMPDDEILASGYLERILAIVKEGEFKAETLREVLPKDSAEADFQKRLATDCSIRIKAIRKSGKLPNDLEELRRSIEIMPRE
jgi:hypothetical protein